MIEVSSVNGQSHLINPEAIVRVSEAGVSGQWHGIRSYIKTFDGATIECQQSVQEVQQQLKALELSRLSVGAA